MNFNEYLNEHVLMASDDMKKYVEDAVSELIKKIEKYVTYNHFKEKENRSVLVYNKFDSKYGSFENPIKIYTDSNTGEDAFIDDKKDIYLIISKDVYDDLNSKDKKETRIKQIKKSLLHELLHIVDPKYNKEKLKDNTTKKSSKFTKEFDSMFSEYTKEKDIEKRKQLKIELENKLKNEYFKFPWEVDAYLSSEAEEIVEDIFKKSKNKRDALNYVKNLIPENDIQKLYHSDEKIWKRFIQHLVKLIERKFI